MTTYAPAVRQYFRRPVPPGSGDLAGEAGSAEQGVRVRFTGELSAGRVQNPGFRAMACPHIIAACHRVIEALDGQKPGEFDAEALDNLLQDFEIPVEKAGKLLILKDALAAFVKAAADRCQEQDTD